MRKQLLALALIAAGCAAQAADTPGSNPNAPQVTSADRMANARKALAAKDFSTAQRELNLVVREDPRNADAHNLMGYSYRKRSSPDITKAFEHYYTALRLDPRHKGAHEYIGQAYLMEKRPAQAEQHLVELEKICGNKECPEYQELAKAIGEFKAAAK
jgi:Tfp pilus assembly protein PilF